MSGDPALMPVRELVVPSIDGDATAMDAALAMAGAGFVVGPLRNGTKHPGSVLGAGWPNLTSGDAPQIVDWYAGQSGLGLFLDAGASDLVIIDVDRPELVPPVLAAVLHLAPFQSTRADVDGRGHYPFRQPPGRRIGCSTGKLAGGWGEVRGVGGVIVVAPTVHAAAGQDPAARYQWVRTGPVPVLPAAVADLLPDAGQTGTPATPAVMQAFHARHTSEDRPQLLETVLRRFRDDVIALGSRHDAMAKAVFWATREAAAGVYSADHAEAALRQAFLATIDPGRRGGQADAVREFRRAWMGGVGAVTEEDVAAVRAKLERNMPSAAQQTAQLVALAGGRQGPARTSAAALSPVVTTDVVDVMAGVEAGGAAGRRITLTPASAIAVRRVLWLWHYRMALGSLALLAGREGLGKSTLTYTLAAQVSRGQLDGEFKGQPKAVLVCATEDSWSHTIAPRLIAAGADLDRVFRVEVRSADDVLVGLSLPHDVGAVEDAARETDAALLILDPLLSRLDGALDSHKDAEVRRALEPLVAMADRSGLLVVGLLHHNKSTTSDPLSAVMGSRAFTAVARSVSTVVADPDDDTGARRLFGTPKNNLGPDNLPSLAFSVARFQVPAEDGLAETSRIVWHGEVQTSIRDAMELAGQPQDRSATAEAVDWLQDYLAGQGGEAAKAELTKAARAAGHSDQALRRARERLHLETFRIPGAFPSATAWRLPVEFTAGSRVTPGQGGA